MLSLEVELFRAVQRGCIYSAQEKNTFILYRIIANGTKFLYVRIVNIPTLYS